MSTDGSEDVSAIASEVKSYPVLESESRGRNEASSSNQHSAAASTPINKGVVPLPSGRLHNDNDDDDDDDDGSRFDGGVDSVDGGLGIAASARDVTEGGEEHTLSPIATANTDTRFRSADREKGRERMRAAQKPDSGALQVALDMGMGDSMSAKELHKLAGQVRRLYGSNLRHHSPAHLHLTSLTDDGRVARVMRRYCDGFDRYVLTRSSQSHAEIFSPDSLVYLTPDSPNALTTLDPTKVYVSHPCLPCLRKG
jgi:hypothetical protein